MLKNFLITGGSGFIGSHFVELLLSNNKKIINIDIKKDKFLKIKNKNYKFFQGNICNYKFLDKIINKKIDCIVNFAAQTHVDRSIDFPKDFVQNNILGTFNILEILRKKKLRPIFTQISTDEVFGSLEKGSANEMTRFNPSSPYSATKAGAELLINAYSVTYGCDCIITRCTNNYGPRQFPEKLIPKIILLAQQDKKIPIYGTGTNIRDWIYVEDHCDAVFKVLNNGKSGESYNISANNEIDNITIVQKILSLMNKSEDLIEYVEDRPGHDFRYSMDSSKIRKELDWKTNINFEEGLKKTIDWYLSNKEWWKIIVKDSLKQTPWKN